MKGFLFTKNKNCKLSAFLHYFKFTILKNFKVSSKWSKASQLTIEKTLKSTLDTKEIKPVSLKEINPECSLEGLILRLKLQYFGHLTWRADSLEKTLMLGKTEGSERRGARGKRVGWHHSLSGHSSLCAKLLQWCLTLWDPMGYIQLVSCAHGGSPGKNTGVDCHALLQGIFPTQGSNLHLSCLPHRQQGSLPLVPRGKPQWTWAWANSERQ